MEVYVGTSGWMYSWNPKRSLSWYVENSGFNAVELNASFYRFPTNKQILSWKKYNIRWAVKVNRLITHIKRLNDVEIWNKFESIVKELNPDFYLFQMPPSFKFNEENLMRVKKFEEIVGEKMAIEFRDPGWYQNNLDLKITVVSIDSPLGVYIVNTSGTIYLRMHGRSDWYFYEYKDDELKDDIKKIIDLNPKKVYIFFNNDLWMLENGRRMLELLNK
ncbi:DUF72 domain-containing protein [Acidianus sulfidivorans JP7]|uniref:DUF72 domain-containing protein n=1 Tax=Acidianus sulfidivorans JP7 TaxID=619593 RepID=A0A2U9ILT3_9CREN|nr:DUF72 domain-containing protein [Acidianus sulfidivorans]AWR96973.1 DUF72 domain-containing protein [Acidianus sulfidivorans JP7]